MEIRKATELDRNDIAFIYADAFSDDWKQLSTDTEKMARALRNGHILNNYIVAPFDFCKKMSNGLYRLIK